MLPQNNISDGMKIISVCPVCNKQYNPVQAKIIDEIEDARLVYIACKACESSVVAVIVQGGLGVSSVGLVTDLNSDEVAKFKDMSQISADEILEIHSLLINDSQFIDLLPVAIKK